MVSVRHFVLTRFNVRLGDASTPPDDEWLRVRLALFERFTVPSIESQDVPPDRWIVFVDVDSPDWLVSRLETAADIERVTGVFTPAIASEAVGSYDSKLITTRLDCDDAIARDYVGRVQAEATNLESGFINFKHGLQLAGDRLYRRSDPSNAFISRVEQPPFETVFALGHSLVIERYPVRQVSAPPCWLQVIHDANLASTVHGIRTTSAHLSRFAVADTVTDDGLALDRVRTTATLAGRVARRPHRIVWAWRLIRR